MLSRYLAWRLSRRIPRFLPARDRIAGLLHRRPVRDLIAELWKRNRARRSAATTR